jgi:hypothetical protein
MSVERKKRIQRDWAVVFSEFEHSGMTIQEICRSQAISQSLFYRHRKNWLFFGSDNGGRTAAILFSLTQSAKRHNLNMFTYLQDIIARISDHPAHDLHELLPDKWTAKQ